MRACELTSTDFCRCARRIRWVHRDDSLRRSRALKNLSVAFDARRSSQSRRDCLVDSPSPRDPLTVRTFAQRVADEIDSGTLLYSRRLQLLGEARRRGIRRFDANLIIAAVQDRAPQSAPPNTPKEPSRSSIAASFAVALSIEVMIALGAWCVVFG